jgi:Zinc finger, C3HC4 type (RING finger)
MFRKKRTSPETSNQKEDVYVMSSDEMTKEIDRLRIQLNNSNEDMHREKRRADQNALIVTNLKFELSNNSKQNVLLKSRIRLLEDTQSELRQKCQGNDVIVSEMRQQSVIISELRQQSQMQSLVIKEMEINSTVKAQAICGICEDRPIDSIFLPCNHAYACRNCASNCKICPVCRGKLGIGTIYLNK